MAWLKPQRVDEALKWMNEYEPKIVCGGTDLFVNWQSRKRTADAANWLDIQGLQELKQIERTEEGLVLGAAVTASQLWQDERAQCFPSLQQAARIVGGWQIQNRASIGGNLANASPAADMVVPLAACKAVIRVSSANGSRSIPISDFLLGPRTTALKPNEMITSVLIPQACLDVPQIFLRHDQRGATDISIVSVALIVKGSRDQVEWASAAVGAANPVPYTLPELEHQWKGGLNAGKLTAIAESYAAHSKPITDVRASAKYRQAMVKVYVERAAKALLGME
ncbi:FAD binding domain-containing protein [Paenibacillus piri]|uniref:FAD-binding PCMH-type domain-containing protein n=1 Tax=Paenibacillus piri TaxID=2547395 RepID=A0A4R5KD56_9BACL|nr:FAD binding domain-containing protein [Paenibacillus piri]TDF92020.1 hypothetical protein E1757_31210 [Paenibacillus piri]